MSQPPITVVMPTNPLVIVMQTIQLTVQGNIPMNFQPFSFTCNTQGQTMFGPLAFNPSSIWVYITGSAQNQENGDFTINDENYIVTSQGCNLGDTIYGMMQI